jgi:hypothetical protein
MNSREYIIKRMRKMAASLDNALLAYAYEKTSGFHIIEVSRETVNTVNNTYEELEATIWKEFYELFPNEDLLISEPDSIHDMSNIICLVENKDNHPDTRPDCQLRASAKQCPENKTVNHLAA